jgi:hypothetical protein
MFHAKRVWCISPQESREELARLLTEHTWTLCTAFEIGHYLFLNDSTSEDAIVEFAVVKRLLDSFVQVESITFGWCDYAKALDYVQRVLSGEFDSAEFAHAVEPRLETAAEHRARYCPLCA